MAEAILQVVIENLNSLMGKELGLLYGVEKEMEKLSSTLSTIQAVLEDAEERQPTDKPLQNWLRKLKDAAYELDDILDECATEASRLSINMTVSQRRVQVIVRRETGSVVTQRKVHGREEDRERILECLVKDVANSDDISIYPVVVIDSVCRNVGEVLSLDLLQRRLSGMLNGKRHLLVLDNVWNEDQQKWNQLKYTLNCGAQGSSIILTTRLAKVASIVGTLPVHHLSGLSEDDCWSLFKQQAFAENTEQPLTILVVGKEIVKKCKGVSLPAKTFLKTSGKEPRRRTFSHTGIEYRWQYFIQI
ncbi:Disease resistance protein [Melia azedarach]|uniref:Disease resistance protein n=1 Tax=Melia azedarach TaxID=155640 RepID=A0ACC1XZ15_MELAZ|nr:Disease resistance protein [Melia azedarach]